MLETLLPTVCQITERAGQEIMRFYQGAFAVQEKSPDNPVTEADLASNALLQRELGALLPEAGWLSEETADTPERLSKAWVWVVDPLDGTKEFVQGLPEFTVAVGLVHHGRVVLGVIYNPVTQELFAAAEGLGLSLNGRPAGVSGRQTLAGARVSASRSERKRGEFAPFEGLLELTTVGSVAYKLARTAVGQADATWSRGPKYEWDICAGACLLQEGGGVCVDLDDAPLQFNQPFPKVNGIVADNGQLHTAVMTALAPHRATARTGEERA